ncbi:hypothetical protein SAURM35S_04258 [Streptomyces aurantiogriseus]
MGLQAGANACPYPSPSAGAPGAGQCQAAESRADQAQCQGHGAGDYSVAGAGATVGDGQVHSPIAADPALAAVHVVILTNYGLDEYVLDALRAGAAGFLVKDVVPEDFLHAVRVAARGDALLAPSITRKLINRYVTQPLPTGTGTGLEELTSREREAVVLAARGLSNDEIAARMVISPLTAKTHINRAMTKLQARDRAQLVVFAYESGLVAPRNS